MTTTVTDRSGQNNHGYFNGGATSSAKVAGKLGQALNFDGVNDQVSTPLDLTANPVTECAWIKYEDSTGNFSIIMQSGGGTTDFSVIDHAGNSDFINIYNNGSPGTLGTSAELGARRAVVPRLWRL